MFVLASRLIEIDTQTLKQTTLLDPGQKVQPLSPSSDGESLLITSTNGWRSLLSHDEGFRDAVLADDGLTAFALTGPGRSFRIEVNTRNVEQLYAPAPSFLRPRTGGAYPGSLIRITSNALFANTRFTLDGDPLPVIRRDVTFVDIQIPWKSQFRSAILEASPEDSPITSWLRIELAERPIPWIVAAATSDFTSLVTPTNPTPLGSPIHFYGTSLRLPM